MLPSISHHLCYSWGFDFHLLFTTFTRSVFVLNRFYSSQFCVHLEIPIHISTSFSFPFSLFQTILHIPSHGSSISPISSLWRLQLHSLFFFRSPFLHFLLESSFKLFPPTQCAYLVYISLLWLISVFLVFRGRSPFSSFYKFSWFLLIFLSAQCGLFLLEWYSSVFLPRTIRWVFYDRWFSFSTLQFPFLFYPRFLLVFVF